jgi:peptide/nickel transport system substrate-binding protein
MGRNYRRRRSGWVKATLLVLVGLLVGAAVGHWALGRWTGGDRKWQTVDELHQMCPVPSGFNFVESNKANEGQLMALIHDTLLHYDPVQDQLVPGLARTTEASPDGLTWTCRLRDAKTPDGGELTADDVVFSFNLCLDPHFDCKKRGNLMIAGKPIEATATDPRTVTFRLAEPFHAFPWALSGVTIVPKATFANVVGDEKSLRQAVGVQQPELKYLRGFGPFFIESQDTQEVHFVRNDKFWGRGDEQAPRPRLNRITFVFHSQADTTRIDFGNDDRYPCRVVPPMEGEQLRERPDFQVLDGGLSGWCMFFWLNQNPQVPWGKEHPQRLKLFQEEAFRRALAHAIDRHAIIRRARKGYAEPLYGPASPIFRWVASPETLEDVTPKYDRDTATAELAALGVKSGEPDADGKRWLIYEENGKQVPLEIEIRVSQSEEDVRRKVAEEVKSQLEAIGVHVKVVEEDYNVLVTRLDKTFDYEAAVMALNGSPDAATLRFFFESSGPMHFVNPYQKSPATEWERRVDEDFKRYATSPDAAERDRAILDLQKTWSAAQPAFHLFNDRKLIAVRRDYEVNGMALTGRAMDPLLDRTVIENVRLRRLVPR